MKTSKLFLLPLIGSITAVLAFSTSYIVAVVRGDVYPWWPYISDTGTTVPESCIFGELLTLTAIIGMVVVFIRFKWIQSIKLQDKKVQNLNIVSMIIGIISCIAMTFVANFQETSIRSVHMPSSSVTFGFAIVYNMLHAFITRRIRPAYGTTCLWLLRFSLAMVGVVSFGLLYGFGITAEVKGKGFVNNSRNRLEWDPNDPGWGLHLVSTISEWVIGISIVGYFLTYIKDFSKIKLNIKSEEMYNRHENAAAAAQSNAGQEDVEPLWSAEENLTQNS